MNTALITPPSRSPSCPTTRHVSFPMLGIPGPSFSPGMVASSELSPAQALPTGPISRTLPPTGGSKSRSRPSTPVASSTMSSSRYIANSTRSGLFPVDLFLSPSHFRHYYATSFPFSSRLFSSLLITLAPSPLFRHARPAAITGKSCQILAVSPLPTKLCVCFTRDALLIQEGIPEIIVFDVTMCNQQP